MPTADPDAGNQWQSYRKGWVAGASSKPLDPVFTGHTNEKIRVAYEQGYTDGRLAINAAMQKAADRYRYRPSILRTCSEEPLEVVVRAET
jgi:hypothetical protein